MPCADSRPASEARAEFARRAPVMNREAVVALLARWRVWYHAGLCPGPQRVISWWGPMILDRNVAACCRERPEAVVDPTEAEFTDRAVLRLPSMLRNAVVEEWIREGTQHQKTQALRICRTTFYNRLERAYVEIAHDLSPSVDRCGIRKEWEVRSGQTVHSNEAENCAD